MPNASLHTANTAVRHRPDRQDSTPVWTTSSCERRPPPPHLRGRPPAPASSGRKSSESGRGTSRVPPGGDAALGVIPAADRDDDSTYPYVPAHSRVAHVGAASPTRAEILSTTTIAGCVIVGAAHSATVEFHATRHYAVSRVSRVAVRIREHRQKPPARTGRDFIAILDVRAVLRGLSRGQQALRFNPSIRRVVSRKRCGYNESS